MRAQYVCVRRLWKLPYLGLTLFPCYSNSCIWDQQSPQPFVVVDEELCGPQTDQPAPPTSPSFVRGVGRGACPSDAGRGGERGARGAAERAG